MRNVYLVDFASDTRGWIDRIERGVFVGLAPPDSGDVRYGDCWITGARVTRIILLGPSEEWAPDGWVCAQIIPEAN